jgi:hypothetical protein
MRSMDQTIEENEVIRTIAECAGQPPNRCKCSQVIQSILEHRGRWNRGTEVAVANAGYEHPHVGPIYETIRDLVARGMLIGAGDLKSPAGPRYTECGLPPDLGREAGG